MAKQLGSRETHELSELLQEYSELRNLVVDLQEEGGSCSDPGQQLLISIYENLSQVETQIREMDDIIDVFLRDQ